MYPKQRQQKVKCLEHARAIKHHEREADDRVALSAECHHGLRFFGILKTCREAHASNDGLGAEKREHPTHGQDRSNEKGRDVVGRDGDGVVCSGHGSLRPLERQMGDLHGEVFA